MNKLAPKKITHKEYQAPLEYAYHLDATKFASFLRKHGTEKLGINHIFATIKEVERCNEGNIDTLVTTDDRRISADFFVDCSGFASKLLGEALEVDFIDKGQQLLVDTAVAIQVPLC